MPDIDDASGASTRTGHEASSSSAATSAQSKANPTRASTSAKHPAACNAASSTGHKAQSVADLLFQALNLVFGSRISGGSPPPWRAAAFAKRLLTASLHWPASPALRALVFAKSLIAREGALEALLSSAPGDRVGDGVYRADVDDPQLCNPLGACLWELHVLKRSHADAQVREMAGALANYVRG